MRRLILICALLFLAEPALAQFTLVSGTVTDTNGMAYAGGKLTITISLPTGTLGAYLNGAQIGGTVGPLTLDNLGGFLSRLADNTQIQCANAQGQLVACVPQTQWTFTATSTGVAPPIGTGPQTCTSTKTISGTSQTVTFACPPLARVGSGSTNTFNPKTYGAKGDTQVSQQNCTLTGGQPTMTCATNPFAPTDVNKRANCGLNAGGGLFFPAGSTIASFVSASTVNLSGNSVATSSVGECAWGTVDDAAINQAVAAFSAAIHTTVGGQGPQFIGLSPGPPTLYFPSGAYLYCGSGGNPMFSMSATQAGATILGDAPRESWLVSCDTPTSTANLGFFINQQSGGSQLVIKNLAFTSALQPTGGSPLILNGQHHTEDLYVTHWNNTAGFVSGGSGWNLNLIVDTTGQAGTAGAVQCTACNDEFHYGGSSNNPANSNTSVGGAFGLNAGLGPRFYNWLNDEGSCIANVGCFNVQNTSDLWIIGSSLFGVVGGALVVDGHSFVHINSSVVGVFGTDTNEPGLVIQTGGQVQSSDVRYVSTGTAKCITNNGSLYDNGGNTCETQFPISTTSSSGTTATLTVTTVGANVNTVCSVGDTLVVTNVNNPGYNGFFPFGVSAVGTNTIQYTTQGSNIGASTGGIAFCRNLQTYTGNLPKALLNSPVPNTCYVTGTFAATTTAAPMCTFKLQSATNVSFIKASSTTTTACTVAPVVTISDGTVSETLTITTAKSIWDSSVDASTGVGTTIFKPNGTITVTNTAGTCTTSPTNFGVSYNVQPILSN